jgi:hypothetical protein
LLTESNISNIASTRLDARLSFQLKRRVVAEQHLGSVLDRSASCVDEFLQEHFAVHAVCLFSENGAENDRHAIVRGLDVDSLLVAVVNGPHAAALPHTLRRRLGSILAGLLVQGGVLVKRLLKGRGHGVALEQADAPDQIILLLLGFGQVLEVYLHAEVVALLRGDDVGAVLALQDLVGAVLDQLFVAFYAGGDEDAGLGFGGADVEGDVVEVGDDLVDGGWGGAVERRSVSVDVHWETVCCMLLRHGILRREAVLEDRLDEDVLVVEEQHVGGMCFHSEDCVLVVRECQVSYIVSNNSLGVPSLLVCRWNLNAGTTQLPSEALREG